MLKQEVGLLRELRYRARSQSPRPLLSPREPLQPHSAYALGHWSRHPHVLRLFRAYWTPKLAYLVMELCDGGELFAALEESGGPLPEAQARLWRHPAVDSAVDPAVRPIVRPSASPPSIACKQVVPCDSMWQRTWRYAWQHAWLSSSL